MDIFLAAIMLGLVDNYFLLVVCVIEILLLDVCLECIRGLPTEMR